MLLMLTSSAMAIAPVSAAFAWTQAVTAKPGYINLGMNTTISFAAPAAGT
jgi:hypothetical protein